MDDYLKKKDFKINFVIKNFFPSYFTFRKMLKQRIFLGTLNKKKHFTWNSAIWSSLNWTPRDMLESVILIFIVNSRTENTSSCCKISFSNTLQQINILSYNTSMICQGCYFSKIIHPHLRRELRGTEIPPNLIPLPQPWRGDHH